MKKSQQLKNQANAAEKDSQYMNLMKQSRRAGREEDFIDNWLPELEFSCTEVSQNKNGGYTFHHERYGKCDYYPKANKLLIRKDNNWINNGLRFMKNNIFK